MIFRIQLLLVCVAATAYYDSTSLIVDPEEIASDDNSVVFLSHAKMEELGLFMGDAVLLTGRNGRKTVCIALAYNTDRDNKIGMNECVRSNLGVRQFDRVHVKPCPDIEYGKSVHIRPVENTVDGNIYDDYLAPYFTDMYRPLHQSDIFCINGVDFKVIETDPSPYCIVASETVIFTE